MLKLFEIGETPSSDLIVPEQDPPEFVAPVFDTCESNLLESEALREKNSNRHGKPGSKRRYEKYYTQFSFQITTSVSLRLFFRKQQNRKSTLRKYRRRAKNRVLQQANSMMMKLFEIEGETFVETRSIVIEKGSPGTDQLTPSACKSKSSSKEKFWGVNLEENRSQLFIGLQKICSSPLSRQSLIPKRQQTTKSLESAFLMENFDECDFIVTSEEICF